MLQPAESTTDKHEAYFGKQFLTTVFIFPHSLHLNVLLQKATKDFPSDSGSSGSRNSGISGASHYHPSSQPWSGNEEDAHRIDGPKSETLFSWRVPGAHTLWDTRPGGEISSPEPHLSHQQSAVCAGPMRTSQACTVHCLCQRVWKITVVAWAAQVVFGKQSHKHGGVNSLESLTRLLGFILNLLSRKITVGAHWNMKVLGWITSESRGAIKPGAAQHKRNEKGQNGEVT